MTRNQLQRDNDRLALKVWLDLDLDLGHRYNKSALAANEERISGQATGSESATRAAFCSSAQIAIAHLHTDADCRSKIAIAHLGAEEEEACNNEAERPPSP